MSTTTRDPMRDLIRSIEQDRPNRPSAYALVCGALIWAVIVAGIVTLASGWAKAAERYYDTVCEGRFQLEEPVTDFSRIWIGKCFLYGRDGTSGFGFQKLFETCREWLPCTVEARVFDDGGSPHIAGVYSAKAEQ